MGGPDDVKGARRMVIRKAGWRSLHAKGRCACEHERGENPPALQAGALWSSGMGNSLGGVGVGQ